MTVVRDIPVKMDDGTTLFADVGYPTEKATRQRAPGTFPVLLTQNPYAPAAQPDAFFVSRGYIFAVADVRGTGRSQAPHDGPLAVDLFSPREAKDGVTLVDWAAHHLPGSNGIVGLTGCSFLGITQIFTAAAVGPHSPVKAILPACAYNGYDVYFSGGIPTAIAGLFSAAGSILGTKHLRENAASGKAESDDILAGGPYAYNRAYWQARTTTRVMPDIVRNGIPALLWSGWRATELTGVLDEYAILQNVAAGRAPYGPMTPEQPVTGRYQLIVNAGEHAAGIDPSIELEWFDRWLKNDRNGIDKTPTPMHLFEMRSGRWVNTATDPIVPSYTRYFLTTGGKLTLSTPAGSTGMLAWGKPTETNTRLVYTSAPFVRTMSLAGPVAAAIYASSNNTNLELVATLSDVAPDGRATTITHGALLGSMRATDRAATWTDANATVVKPSHPFTNDTYLTPSRTQRFDIELLPTVWAVRPGHSLRVVVTSQAKEANCKVTLTPLPQQWPCLYTTPQERTLPGGTYHLHYGGGTASYVALPLTTPTSLSTARSGSTATSAKETEPLDWGTLAATPRPGLKPTTTSNSTSTWLLWVLGATVLVLVAGTALWASRKRRGRDAL